MQNYLMQPIHHMDDIEEEFSLAQKLKNLCCDASKTETDSEKAAEIIHQIGLIYRKRSPDKIALLKSAGLFNAAIVRNPSNIVGIKSDLAEICQHVLQIAKAKNHNVDLVKKAEQVKAVAEDLRTTTDAFLKKNMPIISINPTAKDFQKLISEKISASRELNKTIACKYKQIMADISQFCENVMGKPPCEYAIAGMGSLARAEITPYSDFEHIILLFDADNYICHLEYFRWFSMIFHVIILNLRETIIPSLNVNSLNDKNCRLGNWYYDAITPRGISFDGLMPHACKFPLGRTQHTKLKPFKTKLIKPISKMLEYLSSEEDLKNGYHLADILTKTCFVFGNKDIFAQFAKGVQNHINKQSKTEIIKHIQQQVKNDMDKFSIRFCLSKLNSQNKINIKQFVYRSTTIFISTLARLYNISATSCFDVIDNMEQNNKISQSIAKRLQYAVAIATEIRLRVYMKTKRQDDEIDLNQNDAIENFLKIVGVTATINYFQIAYCLQCEIAKQLNLTKLRFYSDPQLMNITINLAFRLRGFTSLDSMSLSNNTFNRFWKSSNFDFDSCITQLEAETNWNSTMDATSIYSSKETNLNFKLRKIIANKLLLNEIYDEALEFFKELLKICRNNCEITSNTVNDISVTILNGRKNFATSNFADVENETEILLSIIKCHFELCNYSDALTFLNRALDIEQNTALNPDKDRNIATTLCNIGTCHIELCNYSDALTFLNRALDIEQNTAPNPDKDRNIAATLCNIGTCHRHLCNYSDALTFLNRALDIFQNTAPNPDKDRNIAITLCNIGTCHSNLSNYSNALTFLNRALDIEQNTAPNPDKDRNIAATLRNIGTCHSNLCNYSDALTFLNRALDIFQNTALNSDKDRNIATTLRNIGTCHSNLSNYSDALTFLNRALDIFQNTAPNPDKDRNIATTLRNIGTCNRHLCNYSDALTFLNRALDIEQNTALNPDKDRNIATTLCNIGTCHSNLCNYSDALTFLNRALDIFQNTVPNPDKDRNIATTLCNIGTCHSNLCNYSDALTFLNRALDIEQNTAPNPDKDCNIATTLGNIGTCHSDLFNYSDALTFLNRALDIFQNTAPNPDKDRNIATTLCNIGTCHRHLCNYSDALTFLNRALDIFQNIVLNPDKDRNIATTLGNIGTCHRHLCNYSDALTFLNRALDIFQNTALNPDKDRNIATTLCNIGTCHRHLCNYSDALTFLNRALDIEQNTAPNPDKDRNIATTLCNIGTCHSDLCNYSDALTFLNRALDIFQNTALNPDKDRNIATTLRHIGTCHIELCSYSDALTFLNRALDIEQNTALNPDKDHNNANNAL